MEIKKALATTKKRSQNRCKIRGDFRPILMHQRMLEAINLLLRKSLLTKIRGASTSSNNRRLHPSSKFKIRSLSKCRSSLHRLKIKHLQLKSRPRIKSRSRLKSQLQRQCRSNRCKNHLLRLSNQLSAVPTSSSGLALRPKRSRDKLRLLKPDSVV